MTSANNEEKQPRKALLSPNTWPKAATSVLVGAAASQPPREAKRRKRTKKGYKDVVSQTIEKIHVQDNKSLGSTKSDGLHPQWRSYHVTGEPILPP